MFPPGAPGAALLVLRICISFALAGTAYPTGGEHIAFLLLLSLVCVGLLTPIACVVAAVSVLFDLPAIHGGASVAIVVLSTLAYAVLGPGAYSVDARLFGRRVLMSTDSTPPQK